MRTLSRTALVAAFTLGLVAAAQAQSASVPMPGANNPAYPVATDGSPLPHDNTIGGHDLLTGRSVVVDPIGGLVGAGVGTAGAVLDTGLGVATGAVDAGGRIVGGTVDAAGQIVR